MTAPTAADVSAKRVAGFGLIVQEAERQRIEADHAVEAATDVVQRAEAALGAARIALAANAADDGGSFLQAEGMLRVARERLECARKDAAEAAEGEAGAKQALEQAEQEARMADLLERASPETLAQRIAAPWADALEAFDLAEAKVAEIYAAYRASVAASSELRANGRYVQDLGVIHAVLPLVKASIDRGLATNTLHSVAPNFDANADPIAEVFALRRALRQQEGRPASNASWLVRQIDNLASCRTTGELDVLEREHGNQEQAKVAAAYVGPPNRRGPARQGPPPAEPVAPAPGDRPREP